MKYTSVMSGAVLPLLLGLSLVAGACKGDEPKGDGDAADAIETAADEVGETANELAEKGGEMAEEAVDAAGDVADEVAEKGSEVLEDVTNGLEDAADAGKEAVEDLAHPKGLNRFAPGGKIADSDLSSYYTTMDIEINGEDVGTMTFEMWGGGAPITVRNHLRLIDEGFYDGLTFHRIMRDFMVQGGCPRGNGTGNSPYGTIKSEYSRAPERSHDYGVLSMASTSAPNSASCQFFVVSDNKGAKMLDGRYTTFGRLTKGVATLEAIANVGAGGPNGTPALKLVTITDAEVHKGEAPKGEVIKRP